MKAAAPNKPVYEPDDETRGQDHYRPHPGGVQSHCADLRGIPFAIVSKESEVPERQRQQLQTVIPPSGRLCRPS